MEKITQKYKEYIILILGFLMTTVGGSFLGFYLQNRSWKHQHDIDLLEKEKTESENVFKELSSLMDNRLYKMRRVYWAKINNKDKEEIEKRMEAYRISLDLWNSNLNKNLALTQRYFGMTKRKKLEFEIQSDFIECGYKIETFKVHASKDLINKLQEELDALNNLIYIFDLELLDAIKANNIGIFVKN